MRSGARMGSRGLLSALLGVGVLLGAGVLSFAVAPGARAASPSASPQGRTWASIAKLPNWQGIWQLDWEHNLSLLGGMSPEDDLTPQAKARYTSFTAKQKFGEDVQPQTANCLPPGMPQIMTQPYPIEFLFNPGKVVILIEAYEQERTVYTDGRSHPTGGALTPTFQGNSIGHWDGDTLVVDTVGFVPDTIITEGIPHSDQMRIIERIRKIDNDHMQITRTIIDPKVLVKPWTVTLPYVREKGDLLEYICEQGNRDSATANGRPGERIGGL